MTNDDPISALTGEILEDYCLSLQQLCHSATVTPEFILQLVEFEVLLPTGDLETEWLFKAEDLARCSRAQRLMRDFELNLSGLALIMQLLDELEELRGSD